MTIPKIQERVEELMILQGMDTSNETLVLDNTIIYLQAQRDLIAEQREESQ